MILHAGCYLNELNRRYKTQIMLSDRVKSCLRVYPWPGNVRELQNVIAGAYASCDKVLIDVEDLPPKVASRAPTAQSAGSGRLADMVDAYEAEVIRQTLRRNNQNVRAAAQELGVERSLLYKKMRRLGITIKRILR